MSSKITYLILLDNTKEYSKGQVDDALSNYSRKYKVNNASSGLSYKYINLSSLSNGIYLMISHSLHIMWSHYHIAIVVKYDDVCKYHTLAYNYMTITSSETSPLRLVTNEIPYKTNFFKLGYD